MCIRDRFSNFIKEIVRMAVNSNNTKNKKLMLSNRNTILSFLRTHSIMLRTKFLSMILTFVVKQYILLFLLFLIKIIKYGNTKQNIWSN